LLISFVFISGSIFFLNPNPEKNQSLPTSFFASSVPHFSSSLGVFLMMIGAFLTMIGVFLFSSGLEKIDID